jgi:hypothetical protein
MQQRFAVVATEIRECRRVVVVRLNSIIDSVRQRRIGAKVETSFCAGSSVVRDHRSLCSRLLGSQQRIEWQGSGCPGGRPSSDEVSSADVVRFHLI